MIISYEIYLSATIERRITRCVIPCLFLKSGNWSRKIVSNEFGTLVVMCEELLNKLTITFNS